MSTAQPTIIYTLTDEAPLLATRASRRSSAPLPLRRGINVDTCGYSVAARILWRIPDHLTPEQRLPNTLADLGKLTCALKPTSSSCPTSARRWRSLAAIKELQGKGYKIPDYPGNPKTDEEKESGALRRCIGSAVNPVLREGNSDRRARVRSRIRPQEPAQHGPSGARPRAPRLAHAHGDFYHGEKSMTLDKARDVKMELITKSGKTIVLKPDSLLDREVIDSMFMSKKALLRVLRARDRGRAQDRRDVLAARQGDDDEGVAPHRVRPLRQDLLPDAFEKHGAVRRAGRQRQQRHGHPVQKIATLPQSKQDEIMRDLHACHEHRPSWRWSTRPRASPTSTRPTT